MQIFYFNLTKHIFVFVIFSVSSSSSSDMQVRSEVQECAIMVALLMFGIIVERFIEVLKETLNRGNSSKSSATSAPVVILSEGDHKPVDKYEIKY